MSGARRHPFIPGECRDASVLRMVQVVLVTETWSKQIEVDSADELIEAEGMSWERDTDDRRDGDRRDDDEPDAGVLRYVPAVSG
jgi:hypothetical protein